ncbi:hypothetical protein D3C73_1461280 [compost metagenome]
MVFVLNIGRMINIYNDPVGASLLAMSEWSPRASSLPALSLTTIASKLAPTGVFNYWVYGRTRNGSHH